MTSTSSDFQRAVNFARQWQALPQNRRARLARDMPVATIQAAALGHPDFTVRRFCLFLLDHYASDASWEVFRRALRDPVPAVREGALHGIACERCRVEALPVPDVVGDLVAIMALTGIPKSATRQWRHLLASSSAMGAPVKPSREQRQTTPIRQFATSPSVLVRVTRVCSRARQHSVTCGATSAVPDAAARKVAR